MKIVENIEVQIREVLSGSVGDNHANLTSYSMGMHTVQIYASCIAAGLGHSLQRSARASGAGFRENSSMIHSMDSTKARFVYLAL